MSLLDEPADSVEVVHRESGVRSLVGLPLRIGVFAGWHATAGDLDVLGERVPGKTPEPGPAFGLRLGWRVTSTWGLELTAGAVPAGSEWLVPLVGELRWRPLGAGATWTPTLGAGAGVYVGVGAGGDVDLLMSLSGGVEIGLGATTALRVELGVWGSDAVSGALAVTPVVTLGIDLLAWREVSQRPIVSGPRVVPIPRGCPAGVDPARCGDVDGDGIIDAFDRCPVDAGTLDGCADADGDGVPGPRDACPARAGRIVDWGCPR